MKTSFLTSQGLPIGEPLSFLEVYIMSLNCPYCLSDQVIQVVNQQVNGTDSTGLAASASFATIGASISKELTFACITITWWYCRCSHWWLIQQRV